MEEVVGIAFEFFHLVDALQLALTSRTLNTLVQRQQSLAGTFEKLIVHGMDSSDHSLDLQISDHLLLGSGKTSLLDKYKQATEVIGYNFDESFSLLNNHVFSQFPSVTVVELHNVVSLGVLSALPVEISKLRLGLNLRVCTVSCDDLRLPSLTSLEVRGFPFFDAFAVKWLMQLLASTTRLKSLTINCPTPSTACTFTPPTGELRWSTDHLFFLEIVSSSEHSTTNLQRLEFSRFADFLVSSSSSAFPRLNTVTLNAPPSVGVWARLSACDSLLHVVISNIGQLDLKIVAQLVQNNVAHLQILVLKFAGKTNLHLDSVIQAILNANKTGPRTNFPTPPLERLEIDVGMDETSCVMDAPFHTIKAAATLRCRYRDNMYFKRTKFGFQMALDRELCTSTCVDLSIASPMELFAEEMVRHTFDDVNAPQVEAEMINEWNRIGQVQRAMYVEIYDDFVDRELRSDEDYADASIGSKTDEDYCDVSATMAYLRE